MKMCNIFSVVSVFLVLFLTLFLRKEIVNKVFPQKNFILTKIISSQDKETIIRLNKALADEWLAYYQYWIGSKIAKGHLSEKVIEELVEHAADEKKHADMLIPHIIKLGGIPIIDFDMITQKTSCGYLIPPVDGKLKLILEQNIFSERCAIKVYEELIEQVDKKHKELIKDLNIILKEEIEHESDLLKLLPNFK
jgi:bacterioferritin